LDVLSISLLQFLLNHHSFASRDLSCHTWIDTSIINIKCERKKMKGRQTRDSSKSKSFCVLRGDKFCNKRRRGDMKS
jgi:hypothetical protein